MWSFSNMNMYESATIACVVLSAIITFAMGRYIAKSDAKDGRSRWLNPAPLFYVPLIIASVACICLFGSPDVNLTSFLGIAA